MLKHKHIFYYTTATEQKKSNRLSFLTETITLIFYIKNLNIISFPYHKADPQPLELVIF